MPVRFVQNKLERRENFFSKERYAYAHIIQKLSHPGFYSNLSADLSKHLLVSLSEQILRVKAGRFLVVLVQKINYLHHTVYT